MCLPFIRDQHSIDFCLSVNSLGSSSKHNFHMLNSFKPCNKQEFLKCLESQLTTEHSFNDHNSTHHTHESHFHRFGLLIAVQKSVHCQTLQCGSKVFCAS